MFRCFFSFSTIQKSYLLLSVCLTGRNLSRLFQDSDVNYFPPEWKSASYTGSVLDSSPVGSAVLTLVATDRDRGKNGLVTYRFTPQQTDTSLGVFTLDQSSGEVSVGGFSSALSATPLPAPHSPPPAHPPKRRKTAPPHPKQNPSKNNKNKATKSLLLLSLFSFFLFFLFCL